MCTRFTKVKAGVDPVVYGGDCRPRHGYVSVLKILATGENRGDTGVNRDATGANLGSLWPNSLRSRPRFIVVESW